MKRLQGLNLFTQRLPRLTVPHLEGENEELREDLKKISEFEKIAETAKNREIEIRISFERLQAELIEKNDQVR